MKVNKSTTIELTTKDIEDIIKGHMSNQGYNLTSIDFNISNSIEGTGVYEHPVSKFIGCTVRCEEER